MAKRFLIDTNILIYYGNNQLPGKSAEIIEDALQNSFNISVISKMEYLGWKKHTEETYRTAVKFIENANIFNLDDYIVESTIRIKRENVIRLPDALIASTAIVNNLVLLTRNHSDFKDIHQLRVLNPFE